MVQVRQAHPKNDDGSVNIARWIERLPIDPDQASCDQLYQACELAWQCDQQGQRSDSSWSPSYSAYLTGLEMAEILAELHLDQNSLIAAIIYRVVRDGHLSIANVRSHLGDTVATLVKGVMRMAAIAPVRETDARILGQAQAQGDNIRKMLVAMVDDVRVALIKLAERTCAIRAVKDNEEKRVVVAKEVYEIYAPLAHRLGIGHIKWELEDLSFRYLQPQSYKRIAKQLDERRLDRQDYIEEVIAALKAELNSVSIEGDLSGRAKHIYSIWRKMQRKQIVFSQVYDIRAVRILVPKIADCYTVLGIVHTLWRNIPKEFDDYIAIPKENGYRSLHTAVVGPGGKVMEVQIRTFEMHEEAEFGVCAHWRYKGTDKKHSSDSYEDKIAWLRQVLDLHEESGRSNDPGRLFGSEFDEDRIYVFTPDGHVVDLGKGATPLDFAYHVHTEVGHSCRGAKVNGRIVPLTYQLQTGEQVDVITGKECAPSRDWLRPKLAYLKSTRARAKVRHWFKQQDREHNIATGRILLEKEFKRLALTSLDYKAVAKKVHFDSVEDMYAAVGAGDLGPGQVINAAQGLVDVGENKQIELSRRWQAPSSRFKQSDVTFEGVGNLLTQIAKCCKPVPGDAITGYITVGRGVSIHRQDCTQVLQLQSHEPERIIQVSWGIKPEQTYPVDVLIQAYDRHGLLRDITVLLATEGISLLAANTQTDINDNTASIRLTVEIISLEALGLILAKLNRLPNIISVARQLDGK